MQYHLNGFRAGDPELAAAGRAAPTDKPPAEVDVLIVGCGPAGLTLAAQLSAFPDITTCIVEQKDGPLQLGQADGIACRSMEMFEGFGFRERLQKQAYWVNETTFWRPDESVRENIVRSGRIQDVEDGLSDFPHVILNQARVHDFYLEFMAKSSHRLEPLYARRFVGLETSGQGDHPVTVKLERIDDAHKGETETVRAKYVVGCDGARSGVRQALGRELKGDFANQAWGVMDVLAVTTFPDIRMKSLIQSANEGAIVLIPREGGYLVRIYVELDKVAKERRVPNKEVTIDYLIDAARRIFHPYTLDVKEVAWWSVYEVGQRLCDKFDDVREGEAHAPRVFIAGDACHTHSAKAGQGMNVSMQDTFNLGWKLAAVLRGQCAPDFLNTYSAERQTIAKNLIDFDREWTQMLSKPLKSPENPGGVEPAQVQDYFQKHGRYTAGVATVYKPSLLTGESTHQHLAKGFEIGARFHSGPVVRLGDGKPGRLGDVLLADGRWRVLAFCGREDPASGAAPIRRLCDYLEKDEHSPMRRYTRQGADVDSVIDFRAIFQQPHRELALQDMPGFLLPAKGKYGLRDYEKMFCPDLKNGPDIFNLRGIDRDRGALVIVRPDQYVAHVLPFDAHKQLAAYFDGFMTA
ncbi:MAG: FAD-binding monooxygenase, partial [Hyphomicrobiales bacterium]|nr:FAD-binding monooxygenase [Hyphomicrobiales bacterium]